MEEVYTPYFWDSDLMKELGLTPFKAPHATKTYVGEVDNEYWKIKIWVKAYPAQFWRFEIFNKEAQKIVYILRTGSGSFTDYWKTAKNFAEGMLAMEELN